MRNKRRRNRLAGRRSKPRALEKDADRGSGSAALHASEVQAEAVH